MGETGRFLELASQLVYTVPQKVVAVRVQHEVRCVSRYSAHHASLTTRVYPRGPQRTGQDQFFLSCPLTHTRGMVVTTPPHIIYIQKILIKWATPEADFLPSHITQKTYSHITTAHMCTHQLTSQRINFWKDPSEW